MKSFRFLSSIFVCLLFFYFLAGCKAGRPARATLPDQLDSRDISEDSRSRTNTKNNADNYGIPGLPFYAVDTSVNGKSFTAIYLRNAEFDSLAFSIVKSYEPFANSLLKIITEQGIKGILIDFRQNNNDGQGEAKFSIVQDSGNESDINKSEPLNIVFLWDEVSASRAAGFMNELNTSPAITVTNISNTGVTSTQYRQDCFRPGLQDFE